MTEPNNSLLEAQRQSWSDFAKGWDKREPYITAWMGPVGEKLMETAGIKAGDKILDAATGTGEPGLTAAKRIAPGEVVGTDVSEMMIELAQKNATQQNVTNYTAVVAPTHKLPFKDNEFDAIISRFGSIFAPDVEADLEELKRVVKTGGRISWSAWAEPSKNPWATLIPKSLGEVTGTPPTPPSPDSPGLFRCAAPNSLVTAMEAVGLKDAEQIEVTGEIVVDSAEEYWETMLDIAAPVVGALAKASDEVREKVHQKVVAVLNADYTRDGKIAIPWSAWIGVGTK